VTAEPWIPLPQDDVLDDEESPNSPEGTEAPEWLTAGSSSSSSAPVPRLDPTPGALLICTNCLIDLDEDFYCSSCGRLFVPDVDRPAEQTSPEITAPRGR
jgi:hypothetical protein